MPSNLYKKCKYFTLMAHLSDYTLLHITFDDISTREGTIPIPESESVRFRFRFRRNRHLQYYFDSGSKTIPIPSRFQVCQSRFQVDSDSDSKVGSNVGSKVGSKVDSKSIPIPIPSRFQVYSKSIPKFLIFFRHFGHFFGYFCY